METTSTTTTAVALSWVDSRNRWQFVGDYNIVVFRVIGLGIYGDSNSESEDEAADVVEQEQNDSDEELKV